MKTMLTVVAAMLLVIGAVACVEIRVGAADDAETEEAAVDPAATPDELSAEEVEAGFQSLFDGESLDHWRGFKLDQVPAGWSAADGVVHFLPPTGDDAGPRADLLTREQYRNFEFRFDWAVTAGGNSGVMFHVSEDAPASYSTGPEFQILDDGGHRDGQRMETSAASNYALHARQGGELVPVGEFNTSALRVEGNLVTHWLNGEKVVEYVLWDDDWKALVEASKFASMPGYGMMETGHIALQDHGNEIWFRNLRILVLPD
ncbi:MAG: DUF1080 domain-containing protein [Holophagales bacterium]|nr:DUF1080 domain-containing protein [Holophagales bacterium]MYG29518.1 DUF1080 domain-containing protein [Holophagales bacterium]MYI79964.1 DUF1080 domain-containing protein [Holophagales bacterium]